MHVSDPPVGPAIETCVFVVDRTPFRALLISLAVSQSGSAATNVALPLLVLRESHSTANLSSVIAARIAPGLLAPLVAYISSRFDSRTVAATSSVIAGLVVPLFVGAHSQWQLVVLALLWGSAQSFVIPSRMALRPRVIPAGDEVRSNGLLVSVERLSYLVGPIVAGALIAAAGLTLVFFVEACASLLAALVLRKVPARQGAGRRTHPSRVAPSDAPAPSTVRQLLRVVAVHGLLRAYTFAALVYIAAQGLVRVYLPVYASKSFAATPGALGFLVGSLGLGGLVGGVAARFSTRRRPSTVYCALTLLDGALWLLLSQTHTIAIAVTVLTIAGVCESIPAAIFYAEVQVRLHEGLLGPYFAFMQPGFDAMQLLGALAGGALLTASSLTRGSLAIAVTMASSLLLVPVAGKCWPTNRSAPGHEDQESC